MDGSYRWIMARATVFERTADVRAKQIIGVARDMTERKQVEQKLVESEARFHAIVSQAMAGVAQIRLTGRFVFVNRRFCEMVGYSESELLGMTMQGLTHPEDLPGNLERFERLVNGGSDYVVEKRYRRKDGSEVWVRVSVGAVRADGELQHVLAVAFDITDRKRQQAELLARNLEQRALYELADAVNRADALDDLYENALGAIIDSLHADRASILLFDDEGMMRFKAWRGLSEHYRRAVDGHSPWRPDQRNPRAIVLGNVAEAELDGAVEAAIRSEGIQALGFIPLTYGGRLIGKFMVYYNHPHVMDDDEIGLAQAIAGTLALGIERKRAEQALRQRTAQFETLLKEAPIGLYLVDEDFRIREANPTARLAFGDIPDLIGRELDEVMRILWPAAYADDIVARFHHTLETGEPVVIPERIQERLDRGVREYYEWQIHRIPLPEGSYGVVCYFRDIYAQVQARQAIADREGRMRLAMSSAEMGAWDIDLLTGEVTWDAKQYELFKRPGNEPLRDIDQFYSLVHAEDLIRVKAAADEAGKTGRFSQEFRIVLPDGRIRWVAGLGAIVPDEGGRPLRMVGVNYDITERKQSEARLQQFAAQLEHRVAERTLELTQSREQLRALATELNLTEQRERRRLATELHDYLAQLLALGRIRLAQAKQQPMTPVLGKNLNEVQEVLDQALTYARTLVAQLSPPMLKDFGLPMALKWLAEQMQQRDLAVSLELEKDLPPLPEDHAMLLFQSVRELLLNVMKHAETKQARITVREIEGRLHISVADPGKGFELTDSASAAEGDRSPGFGLFSIRERMLSLGGRFELSSRPGMGTEATLIAPLAPHEMTAELEVPSSESAVSDLEKNSALPTQNSELHQSSSPNNSALTNQNSELPEGAMVRVVIADDHAMVRQGLGGLLAGYAGIEVIGEAANGEEAVELAVRLKPDIVLMDVNMPKMDGVEATRRISGSHSSVTIIGLSVDNSRHIEQAMREAGAAAFHTKEAAVDQLYRTIQNVLHKGA